jgi:hypothetical protein
LKVCLEHIPSTTDNETAIETGTSDLSPSLIFKSLDDEKSIEELIQRMENEEQQMIEEIESMEYGEERMKYQIILMKHQENRMENEIKLMKRREKPIEEVVLVWTRIYDDKKAMKDEIEQIKKCENHITYELERMKHYQTRLMNDIRFMKNKNKYIQYSSLLEYENEIELNTHRENLEDFYNELARREAKLQEHSNEMRKRTMKLEKHCVKRVGCEYELEIICSKIQQEEERIEQEKQFRREAIKRREYHEKMLAKRRTERLGRQIKLLEGIVERMVNELQLIENDEKHSEHLALYHTLHKELLRKRNKFYSLYEPVQQVLQREPRSIIQQELLETVTSLDYADFQTLEMASLCVTTHTDYETSAIIEQPKYDIFISSADQNDFTVEKIKNTLPQHFSTHVKDHFSSSNIKICLDNTSTAVIAIINTTYELSTTCQADMTHIFKRQFPLVLVISDHEFKPSTNWLTIVWEASGTQKIFFNCLNFEDNLHSALTDSQWNLSPNLNVADTIQSTTDERSKRFLGDLHEWTIAYSNPAQVSHNYRELINDPLRIDTDTKLQDIYYHYIRVYFENSEVMSLFKEGAHLNNIDSFIRGYTHTSQFSRTLNRHLATNVLHYFDSTLHHDVDYQLVKCLIDFVALCIYRQELSRYLFTGTVYRGVVMSEEDLDGYVVGSRIMNTSFLSTSKDKEVAEVFSGKNQQKFAVLCTFVVNNSSNRRTALDIESISFIPHEREVLILPFSAFSVKSVTRPTDRSGPIEMKLVEDDQDITENMDTMTLTDY